MVKTHKSSRFVLYTLNQIRDCRDVVLQIEDTHTQFDTGYKCYLCEVVSGYEYNNTRSESELIKEICVLNAENRKLNKKINKLEKAMQFKEIKGGVLDGMSIQKGNKDSGC